MADAAPRAMRIALGLLLFTGCVSHPTAAHPRRADGALVVEQCHLDRERQGTAVCYPDPDADQRPATAHPAYSTVP